MLTKLRNSNKGCDATRWVFIFKSVSKYLKYKKFSVERKQAIISNVSTMSMYSS